MKNKLTTSFLFLILGVLNIVLKLLGLSMLTKTETVVFSAIWFALAIMFFVKKGKGK